MPEPKQYKYDVILRTLIGSIQVRDGDEQFLKLRDELKERTREGAFRESVVQIMAKEKWPSRLKMFCAYPELIVPYLWRIKRPKS